MSIAYVDTDTLEQMRDRMSIALSRMEDCAGILRQMHNQMMGEDMSLSYYPQWERAVQGCYDTLHRIELMVETLNRFLLLLQALPGEYTELERTHIQDMERLQTRMSTVNAGLSGIMSEGYPLGLAEGEESSAARNLEQETAAALLSLELANLTSIKDTLEEEYSYEGVIPMGNYETLPTYGSEEEEEEEEEEDE